MEALKTVSGLLRKPPKMEVFTEEFAKHRVFAGSLASPDHPERNEDSFDFDRLHGRFAVVADGLGAEAKSEFGSREAVRIFANGLAAFGERPQEQTPTEYLIDLAKSAHKSIKEHGWGATTVTAVYIDEAKGKAYFISVGDSRLYLAHDSILEQITEDHSVISKVLLAKFASVTSVKELKHWELNLWHQRHVLSQALGSESGLPYGFSVGEVEVKPGDRLVLVTDGGYDNLTDFEIQAEVESGGNLLQAAYERSRSRHFRAKKDDITAVVITIKGIGIIPADMETKEDEDNDQPKPLFPLDRVDNIIEEYGNTTVDSKAALEELERQHQETVRLAEQAEALGEDLKSRNSEYTRAFGQAAIDHALARSVPLIRSIKSRLVGEALELARKQQQ